MTLSDHEPVNGTSAPVRPLVENREFAAFVRRIIRAVGRRVAAGDVEALPELLLLADEVEQATQSAVAGLRVAGYSWAEIAARTGTSRQAAQQRWGNQARSSLSEDEAVLTQGGFQQRDSA